MYILHRVRCSLHEGDGTMSYQERRSIISLITTILIGVIFFVYVLPRYPSGNPYSADIFHFWGWAIVVLIPVSIAVQIAISIAFSMAYTMTTKEKETSLTDERDKLIELRALRNTIYVFTAGFFLAMVSLIVDMPPSVMFIIIMISGYLSGIVGSISQLYFYRAGF